MVGPSGARLVIDVVLIPMIYTQVGAAMRSLRAE